MMAEKARLCKDHRAVGLIMSSSDPSTHKHVGRGVRDFDTAVWDREKQMPRYPAIMSNIRRSHS